MDRLSSQTRAKKHSILAKKALRLMHRGVQINSMLKTATTLAVTWPQQRPDYQVFISNSTPDILLDFLSFRSYLDLVD